MLNNCRVVVLDHINDSALVRFLASLGTTIVRVPATQLESTLQTADVLIDYTVSEAQWADKYPRLIHVLVTPFGANGPRAHWRGSELIASAMSGVLRSTGDPDRPPVKEALDACTFHADMAAAAGALAALYEREVSGRGQRVDVSIQEVAFSRNVNAVLAWQFDKRKLTRAGGALNYGRAVVRCIWPLKDGYCFHSLMTGRFGAPANRALSQWMDEVGMDEVGAGNPMRGVDWLTYNRSTLDVQTRTRWEAAIEGFFTTRTRAEIRSEGLRRGINATVLAEPHEVLNDPHLHARGFWGSGPRFVAIAPGPVQHAKMPMRSADRPESKRTGPLAGIRVLDFSWALVGSITTKILGDLGCEVIKVESRGRPCLSRLDVQVSVSKPANLDDKPWFAHLNSSKRSLALDLKTVDSREVLNPLIDWADVVVENFSPGTLQKLDLDYAHLAARNPSLIMVSGSVFGQTGPLAANWGVDGTGGALSSRTLLTGWPDRAPVIPSAVPYGDVILPYAMAAAVCGALVKRRQTGQGCHIDASMYELCVQQMLPAMHGESIERMGNRDLRVFHQGVYGTRGEDRWIAITLFTERDWERLCALATFDAAATHDERDTLLGRWCATQNDHEVVELLQANDIAAGVVQDIEDLIEHDPQLAARGALTMLDHPLLGAFAHMRTPMSFSRSKLAPYRAPRLGEHSEEIAQTLCRLTPARIGELFRKGVFT